VSLLCSRVFVEMTERDSGSPCSLVAPSLQMLSSILPMAKADPLCEQPHDFSQVVLSVLSITRVR
jgi:hypothetical protein